MFGICDYNYMINNCIIRIAKSFIFMVNLILLYRVSRNCNHDFSGTFDDFFLFKNYFK